MKPIPRIDLTRHIQKHRKAYMDAIGQVVDAAAFSGGPFADAFEEKFAAYMDMPYACGVNNGTTALHLALEALGIGLGDEVIVPANTFIATAWAVSYTGARPVFADCRPDTWEICPDSVRQRLSPATKAIIGVHLYGQPFDWDAIEAIARERGIFVVEDCAQAHGARYRGRLCGSLGDLGCFSFYPGKNLYAFGEAGAVVCREEVYAKHIQTAKNQGSQTRYVHEILGYNMRMEGVQGAVLSLSLDFLEDWTRARQRIGQSYHARIKNPSLTMQAHPAETEPVYHLFVVKTPQPQHFVEYMAELGIECHRHYPIPCHLQKAYAHLGYKPGDLPQAEDLARRCVTLPCFPEMEEEEVERVIEACNRYASLDSVE